METSTQVIITLCIFLVFLGIGFLVLQSDLKQIKLDLDYCTNAYNELSLYKDLNNKINVTEENKTEENDKVNITNIFKSSYFNETIVTIPKCKMEMKIIRHFTFLEGRNEWFDICYRCQDINKSIMEGIISPGDWVCPR